MTRKKKASESTAVLPVFEEDITPVKKKTTSKATKTTKKKKDDIDAWYEQPIEVRYPPGKYVFVKMIWSSGFTHQQAILNTKQHKESMLKHIESLTHVVKHQFSEKPFKNIGGI